MKIKEIENYCILFLSFFYLSKVFSLLYLPLVLLHICITVYTIFIFGKQWNDNHFFLLLLEWHTVHTMRTVYKNFGPKCKFPKDINVIRILYIGQLFWWRKKNLHFDNRIVCVCVNVHWMKRGSKYVCVSRNENE